MTGGPALLDRPTLRNRALVTGGALRIGAAIVRCLSEAGYAVAIHCRRSSDEAHGLARELRDRTGREPAVLVRDLGEPGAGALVEHAAEALEGPIGLLVNSASVFEGDRADTFEAEILRKHMAVNLEAPLALCSAFASQAHPGSSIVNLLDQRVLRSNPRYFSYTLSKSALHAATRMMAQTFAPRVRVNAVAPGLTLANDRQDGADYRRRIATLPLQRGGTPQEVAEVVLFLAGAPSVTGQTIAVDGGQHLGWQTPDAVPNV